MKLPTLSTGIVGGSKLLRHGLASLLKPQISLKWEAETAAEAMQHVSVELAIVQLRIAEALSLSRSLRGCMPKIRALILLEKPADIHACPSNNGLSYLPISASGGELQECIDTIQRGETYLPTSLASELSRGQTSNLSPSESKILALISQGLSPNEAALQLHVSGNTMKTHLRGVYRKLGVSCRTQAVLEAIRLGLVESPRSSGPARRSVRPKRKGIRSEF